MSNAALFQNIADALGVPLTYNPDHDWYATIRVDGIPIWIGAREHEQRISFSVPLIEYTDRHGRRQMYHPRRDQKLPKITVAKERPADRIAADVRRRLVEPAKPIYAEMLANVALVNVYRSQREGTAALLVALGGRRAPHDDAKVYGVGSTWDAEIWDASVTLHLHSIPADVAELVVRIVNDRREK